MNKKITFIRSIDHMGIITDQQVFKDVCLVPCMLNKKYGFDVSIVGYDMNEELLHSEFTDVKFINIKNTGDYPQDVYLFLQENSKDIDIIYLFGGYESNGIIAKLYKNFNQKGKVYIKLDMNRFWLNIIIKKQSYFNDLLKMADLVTVEDKILQQIISNEYKYEVEYLRNGYYDYGISEDIAKKNIILNVGRIGSEQKATNVLIDAFLNAEIPDWELRLVGDVDKSFYKKIDEYKKNPKFMKQVKFLGLIKDKKVLNNEYKKAKIFCMSSIREGCANVYIEAAVNGCYIISTDVDGISDIKKYSTIINVNDTKGLSMALENAANKSIDIDKKSKALQEYAQNECSWDVIVGRLYLLFCVKGLI